MDESDLIGKIAARAADSMTQTDQMDVVVAQIAPPLGAGDLESSIISLGFTPPALLVSLFRQVGNGGFGPGYGLMGLNNGSPDDQGNTAVSLYTYFSWEDPEDPDWTWPERLLPICNWGCAIYSCLDCREENPTVVIWDPNVWQTGTPPEDAMRRMDMKLSEWLAAWANGEDLWTRMFPD